MEIKIFHINKNQSCPTLWAWYLLFGFKGNIGQTKDLGVSVWAKHVSV